MKHSPIYKAFDIVVAPFPFADTPTSKIRPVIVLSSKKIFNNVINHYIVAMITTGTNAWPLDQNIQDLKACGLSKPCVIRLKLFTLDERLIMNQLGALGMSDRIILEKNILSVFSDILTNN